MNQILVALILLLATSAHAAKRSASSDSPFKGFKVEEQELTNGRNSALEERIGQEVAALGLNLFNFQAHGFSREEFIRGQGRTSFPVLYIDPKVTAQRGERITFDLYIARGSEFFVEGEPEVFRGCQALKKKDEIRIHLDKCLSDLVTAMH